MSTEKPKTFIKGFAKEIPSNYWTFMSVWISKADFDSYKADDKWYIKFNIYAKKWPDKYGNTHYMVLNEREPQGQKKETVISKDDLELPF
jgi:hypothetical protein